MDKLNNPIAALLVDIGEKLEGRSSGASLTIEVATGGIRRWPTITVRALRENAGPSGETCQCVFNVSERSMREHPGADGIVAHAIELALVGSGCIEAPGVIEKNLP